MLRNSPLLARQVLPCGSPGTAWALPGRVHLPTVPLPWALLPGKAWPWVRGKQQGDSQPTAAQTPRPRREVERVPARLLSPPVCLAIPPRCPYKLAATGRSRWLGENAVRRGADAQTCVVAAATPPGPRATSPAPHGPASCLESRLFHVSVSVRIHLNLQGLFSHLCSSSAKPGKRLSLSQHAGRRVPGLGRDVQRRAGGVPGPHLPGVSAPITPAPGHLAARPLARPQAVRALPLAV